MTATKTKKDTKESATSQKKKNKKSDLPPPEVDEENGLSGPNVECPFESEQHEGKELANILVPLPPKDVYKFIFEDEQFMKNVYTSMNYVDLDIQKWETNSENGEISRTLKMTANLPSKALGPSTSEVEEIQTLSSANKENSLYIVNCVITNGGIPYGDSFKIYTHYCIAREACEDDKTCQSRVKCYALVKFKKSVFFVVKGLIERNTYEGYQSFTDEIINSLITEAEKNNGEGFKKSHIYESLRKKRITPKSGSQSMSWSLRIMLLGLLMLFFIGSMNWYLFLKLQNIENVTLQRQVLIGEINPTKETLSQPPSIATLEESLNQLKIQEQVLTKHFQTWKKKLDTIFESVNTAQTELLEIINLLPQYEKELNDALSNKPSPDRIDLNSSSITSRPSIANLE